MTHSAEPSAVAPTTPALPAPGAQYAPAPYETTGTPPSHYTASRPIGKRRGAWSVWWLSLLTFGIYYLVWYAKVNAELARFAPEAVTVNPTLAWLSQFVPIVGLVSLANTAGRLNAAAGTIGSPVRASGGMAVLSCFWFASQTRYLQRRLNGLWDTAQTTAQHTR